MKATAKSLRITPKKLNLIADLIRNKDAVEAMEILDFLPKKGAKVLNKVVTSAVANAKTNFKQDESSLYIKEVVVSKGTSFKRWIPGSRGRANPRVKRNAHVTVTVAVKEAAPAKKEKKTTAKAAPKAPAKAKTTEKATKAEPKKTEPKKASTKDTKKA
mgnify:CR=1 FL=1